MRPRDEALRLRNGPNALNDARYLCDQSHTRMRTSLRSIAICTILLSTGVGAQLNDDCSGAIDIDLNAPQNCSANSITVDFGTSTISTNPPFCDAAGSQIRDLWYRVYTGNNTSVMLYLQSFQSAHIGFGFYSACGVTNSCLSPAQGYTEIPVLTPNTYYYLQVYTLVNSNPSNSGLFCMHWFNPPPAPPANDDCANATLLNVGTTCTYTSGDGAWATPSNANLFCNPDIIAEPNDDVWYRFVAPAATTVITVDGDGTSTTGYDAVLAIGDMSSCSGSMDAIACSNTTGPGGVETIITDALVPGQTYYLQVFDADGASPQPGSFGICVYASVLLTVNESAPEDHNLLSLTNTVGLYLVNTPFAEAATCDLLVLDAMGRSVHQSRSPLIPGNARSLDLTELVPGPYVFVVQRAGETRAQRFVRH